MPVRRIPALGTAAAALLFMVALAGCARVEVSQSTALSPPDGSATEFAQSFSMDEGRVAATARIGGSRVVYVFDRTPSGWSQAATLAPGSGASPLWGSEVAVSGDTIAIADPGGGALSSGIEIHQLGPGGWTNVQTIPGLFGDFPSVFTLGLTGDALLVHERSSACDQDPCPTGPWRLFQRSSGVFGQVYGSGGLRQGELVSIGVDQERLVLGSPGYGQNTSSLMAWDATVDPAALLIDELTPMVGGYGSAPYRHVDVAGELVAYESCCTGPTPAGGTVFIRRDEGSGYVPEASFASARNIASISVLPEAVLVADRSVGRWHTFVMRNGVWQYGTNIEAPDAVAATFPGRQVAVGNEVAVRGDGVLWILTINPGPSGRT